MKKYIFLDFNGTIIDDVDLCLDLLNQILENQKKEKVSKRAKKEVEEEKQIAEEIKEEPVINDVKPVKRKRTLRIKIEEDEDE